jgi:AraC-like DNA-binding protein
MTAPHRSLAFVHLDELGPGPVYLDRLAGLTLAGPDGVPPHRHDFQEALWFSAGSGHHRIDDAWEPIAPGTVAVIARGQVHAFGATTGVEGYRLAFSDDALRVEPGSGWDHRTLFNHAAGSPTLHLSPSDAAFGERLLESLACELARVGASGDTTVARPLLVAFLRHLERVRRSAQLAIGPTGVADEFLRLLESGFRAHHDVAHYADALGYTPDSLSRETQIRLGRSAKRLIRDRVLLEARRLLQFTDMSVKAIAAEVGFADAGHFSKAVKQETGMAPLAFRETMRKTT